MRSFKAKDVRKAFKAIRENGLPIGFDKSRKWDIIDERTGEHFAPKATLSEAKRIAADKSRSGSGGNRGTNNALRKRGFRVVVKPHLEKECQEASDIEEVRKSSLDATTKKQLINARLGQGGFRDALVEIWGGKCALTGLDIEPALRASHIKAWQHSDNRERLDASNGLLLAASVDALFDGYLISLDDDGSLLVSLDLKKRQLERIGLQQGSRVNLTAETRAYLLDHRTRFEARGPSFHF